jgi:hypothetical protein
MAKKRRVTKETEFKNALREQCSSADQPKEAVPGYRDYRRRVIEDTLSGSDDGDTDDEE